MKYKKPVMISLIFFILYGSYILFFSPSYITWDELFFFDKGIRFFENFFHTQQVGLLSSLIIFLSPIKNIVFIRILFAGFAAAGLYFYYEFIKQKHSEKAALYATILLALGSSIFNVVSLFFTESLFFFILALLLWYYGKTKEWKRKESVILASIFACLILTRIVGVFVLVYFLYDFYKHRKIKPFLALIISMIVFSLYYLIIGGYRFVFSLKMRSGATLTELNPNVESLLTPEYLIKVIGQTFQSSPNYLLFVIIVALVWYAIWMFKENWGYLFTIITYMLLFTQFYSFIILFERHYFFIFPFLFILIGIGLSLIETKWLRRTIMGLLIVFILLGTLGSITYRVNEFSQSENKYPHFYQTSPEGCVDLRNEWRVSNNEISEVKNLPQVQQTWDSTFTYEFMFSPEQDYSSLTLQYISSKVSTRVNGDLLQAKPGELFGPIVYEYFFKPGEKYLISLEVYNNFDMGGVGQVLVCEKDLY
jgi:hypothetical protein